MAQKRRVQYTQESIDQQLSQIHLLDASSTTENLEQLGPVIKQIHAQKQQEAFLRTLKSLIDAKDAEIERICGDNYQDFVSSVATLVTVRSYTRNLHDKITSLDGAVSQVGQSMVTKKKALMQSKKTAAHLDEAIDTLQSCLRILDLVNRVGEMIKEGKYWSALRTLDDIQSMPPTSLSQTPFFAHLLSSLPSLRAQVKDAVTASMKSWLLEIRNVSGKLGQLAMEAMDTRARRWKQRCERDPLLRMSRPGSAVEMVTNEKIEYDVLETAQVDFKPLYQCIHVYTALDSLEELQRSYQADRKSQSTLIFSTTIPLSTLPAVTEQIAGFFIVESQVLHSTRGFRSERDIDELWDGVITRLGEAVKTSLDSQTDPEVFLKTKETILAFVTTLENYSFAPQKLQKLILVLFEKYVTFLERKFSKTFETIVDEDDLTSIQVSTRADRDTLLATCWLRTQEKADFANQPLPFCPPFSQTFTLCCSEIRVFAQKFYQFLEGVSQHHRDVDDMLSKTLDRLLTTSISERIAARVATSNNFSQICQVITNSQYFQTACDELEHGLPGLRPTQRGGTITLTAKKSFDSAGAKALDRINTVISSKLNDFFELAEYEWTPNSREGQPSMYLYELVQWLTTVVDGLEVKDEYKDDAYGGAVRYVAECLLDFLVGRNIPMINENALSNIMVDIDFIESELRRNGRAHIVSAFDEIRTMVGIALQDTVQEYLKPGVRHASYASVKPKRLSTLLDKLAKAASQSRDPAERERGERRRKEAEAVGRVFPGESR
ncbi:exocyst complex component, sec15 subunit [Exidia glandulosa HHB12029]|uniref:Exocyst complex component SEC15 n=1 Tax=Exidia glandulosa HHB12029 TaxID=1314781 RepID=A0A165QJU7_EXIGL|nr:exocyst complex component, sec15 subunit [Exidia glandulosa HHB12029]